MHRLAPLLVALTAALSGCAHVSGEPMAAGARRAQADRAADGRNDPQGADADTARHTEIAGVDPHAEARALLREREFLRAAELLDRAVKASAEDLEAQRLFGRALLAQGAPEFAEHELEWAVLEHHDLVATREYLAAVAEADGAPRRALYVALLFGAASDDAVAQLASWVWLAALGHVEGEVPRPETGEWPAPLADFLDGALSEAELFARAAGPEHRSFAHYLLGEAARAGLGPWAGAPDAEAARRHFRAALVAGEWRHEGFALAEFMLDRT